MTNSGAGDHPIERLRKSDGTWNQLETDWGEQCAEFGEEFSQFATGSIPVLRDAASDERDDCGVFAVRGDDGRIAAVAQVNFTHLPGYTDKVLRVRHLIMSPALDYGEEDIADYGKILSRMFVRTVSLAYSEMPSSHVKFHLRSPADRQFFADVIDALKEFEIFASVAMRGAWLYLALKRSENLVGAE